MIDDELAVIPCDADFVFETLTDAQKKARYRERADDPFTLWSVGEIEEAKELGAITEEEARGLAVVEYFI